MVVDVLGVYFHCFDDSVLEVVHVGVVDGLFVANYLDTVQLVGFRKRLDAFVQLGVGYSAENAGPSPAWSNSKLSSAAKNSSERKNCGNLWERKIMSNSEKPIPM